MSLFSSADRTSGRPIAPPRSQSAQGGLSGLRRLFATAAVLSATALVVLDGAIVNVALPIMGQSLQASPATSIWVVMSYQMTLVMAILPCAAFGESVGYRRTFVGGALAFTLASALCAWAPSLPWLIAARSLQGLGAAATMSLGVALLRVAYPPEKLGAAIGWNAMTVALFGAAGPTLGALILSLADWRWLFAVNIPVGVLTLAASCALPKTQGSARKLDFVSVALNAGAFGAFVIGADWLTTQTELGAGLIAVAAVGFVALIRREAPRKAPLIPLDLLRDRAFRISVIASISCFAGHTAGLLALPFYLQHGLGQSALATGLYMTPWPLVIVAAAPISGRLSDRLPTALLCAIGGGCLALGLALSALWPLSRDLSPLILFMVISGLGFGFFQTPNNRNMLLSAPRERSGAAGGMQATARLLGQTLGALLMAFLFNVASADLAPRIGLGLGAALALAAGLISTLRIRA